MRNAHDLDPLTPARLRAVLAVATSGSFSAAAIDTGTSQSNVSRSVAAVESMLGTQIFDRSTRTVRLTEAGREFVERATLVHAELEAAVRVVRDEEPAEARVTLASLTSVSELHLPRAIVALGGRVTRFRCIEGLQVAVEHAVVSGTASTGIGDIAHVTDDVIARPLWHEPFRLALAADHHLVTQQEIRLDDIAREPLVGFSGDAELRTTLDRELASARQLRAPDFVVDRYRTALSIVAAGLGVMVVPAITAEGIPPGATLVDLHHPGLGRTIGMLQRPDVALTPVVEALVDQVTLQATSVAGVTRI